LSLSVGLLGFVGCDIEDLDIGGSERYTQDFHYSYALQPGGRISVDNSNGSVEISGWDQDTVDISGTKYARTPELRDALKIEIDHTADTVHIRTVRPSDRRGSMGAKYIIKVPRRTELERIASSNGSIHTLDLEGPARLKTSNGAVRAENLRGSLDVQTSNGRTWKAAHRCTPPTDAYTRRMCAARSKPTPPMEESTYGWRNPRPAGPSSWKPPTVPST
jgi:hypothetical protein